MTFSLPATSQQRLSRACGTLKFQAAAPLSPSHLVTMSRLQIIKQETLKHCTNNTTLLCSFSSSD